MVSSRFRSAADPYVSYLAKPIARSGLNPSVITLFGLVFSVASAFMFASSNLIFAFILLILSSVMDVADGAVARLTNRVSDFGGFLDSITDRYSDAVILVGIALFLDDHYFLIFIVLVGTLLVSYTRARAEKEVEKCDVGFGERAERLVILIIATIIQAYTGFSTIYLALLVLAIITHLTVAQRIWFTHKSLGV